VCEQESESDEQERSEKCPVSGEREGGREEGRKEN